MINNLVIVESPAKAKTIEKFLGSDYKVMSSHGHIRDLSKRGLDIEKGEQFSPVYEIPDDREDLVKQLKKAAKDAKTVWLASDEDREGEAIAWHLYEVLGLKPENTRRIVFHEITRDAILNAIANPREIDINLVDAQQARRVLDRIVGFELSPVLWRRIRPSLSAGRVQSVAVRLIVEREKEINNFRSEPYFRVAARMATPDGHPFRADLSRRLDNEAGARTFLTKCAGAQFSVSDVQVKPLRKSPAPPFTTSTLQQEASRKLGFSVVQTMRVAQKLYEDGHITYMRTDSLNLSKLAVNAISKEITDTLGDKYLKRRVYHTSSRGAQEAHEAIRPTYIEKREIPGSPQEQRLYNLIWKRTIATQMADAEIEKTTVDITAPGIDERFTATGEVISFDGFLKVYIESTDNESENSDSAILPAMAKGENITPLSITATERYTMAPPRYTEASLVKKMEELGIGRPSTYAPTIQTIQDRQYVVRGDRPGDRREFDVLTLADGEINKSIHSENVGSDKGKLIPTDTGIVVNDFLTENFPNVLDYNFTANVEERFDRIAEGNAEWHKEIVDFYNVFHPEVIEANETRLEHRVGERYLGDDPRSGKPVYVKIGRFGPVVQLGDSDADVKPQFASVRNDQSIFNITLDEALKLFEWPRLLGQFEDSDVTVAIGRFGPYVKHGGAFVSIPKGTSPEEITIDEAVALIKAKREAEANRTIKTFTEEPDLQVLNGRYGPYIAFKKKNYKIPKTVENPADLTLGQCREIIAAQDARPARVSRAARSTARSTTRRKNS